MKRISTPTKVPDKFGPGKHGYTDGNPSTGVPATDLEGELFDHIQEELCGVIEEVGESPDGSSRSQVVEAIKMMIAQRSGNLGVDTGAANAYVVAIDPPLSSYADGLTVRFRAVNANTGNSTLNAGAGAAPLLNETGDNLTAGDIQPAMMVVATYVAASNVWRLNSLARSQAMGRATADALYVPRGHIDGLTLQTAGGDQVVHINPGEASDFGRTLIMRTGYLRKTMSAWAAGDLAGGLDTGAVAADTWYTVYLIHNPTSGVTDACLTATSLSPTLPAGFTRYRRIGAVKTGVATTNIAAMVQVSDTVFWGTPPLDIDTTSLSTTAVLYSLTVPPGVKVKAVLNASRFGGAGCVRLSSPDETDTAVAATLGASSPMPNFYADVSQSSTTARIELWTNTGKQIRARANTASTFRASTIGWIDQRGRDM